MASYSEIALVRSMSFLADSQAAIAHNLANVATDGFKRITPVAVQAKSDFQSVLEARLPTVLYREQPDWLQGTTRETGNKFNMAIDGPYFFAVQDDSGRTAYTRNGVMRLDQEGRLVTADGQRYLDIAGQEITLRTEDGIPSSISISPSGQIVDESTGRNWGPIALFEIPDRSALRPLGSGIYDYRGEQQPVLHRDPVIKHGFLEGSNVEGLQEMVRMIAVQRSFQATQRALLGVGRLYQNLTQSMLR